MDCNLIASASNQHGILATIVPGLLKSAPHCVSGAQQQEDAFYSRSMVLRLRSNAVSLQSSNFRSKSQLTLAKQSREIVQTKASVNI
jgi:hypothetical protein